MPDLLQARLETLNTAAMALGALLDPKWWGQAAVLQNRFSAVRTAGGWRRDSHYKLGVDLGRELAAAITKANGGDTAAQQAAANAVLHELHKISTDYQQLGVTKTDVLAAGQRQLDGRRSDPLLIYDLHTGRCALGCIHGQPRCSHAHCPAAACALTLKSTPSLHPDARTRAASAAPEQSPAAFCARPHQPPPQSASTRPSATSGLTDAPACWWAAWQ